MQQGSARMEEVLLHAQTQFQQVMGLGGIWISSRPSPSILLIQNSCNSPGLLWSGYQICSVGQARFMSMEFPSLVDTSYQGFMRNHVFVFEIHLHSLNELEGWVVIICSSHPFPYIVQLKTIPLLVSRYLIKRCACLVHITWH